MIRGFGVDDGEADLCAVVEVVEVVVVVVVAAMVGVVDDGAYFKCDSDDTTFGANASTTESNTSEPGSTGFFKY